MIVVSVEEASFLHPVNRIVRRIEVEDQFARRSDETFDEELDQQFG